MDLSTPDQRMAWRGADLRKDDIAFDLTPRHARALEELLHGFRKRGLGLGQILPEHCRHPALDADLARVFDEVQEGRGIVIIRGIPVTGYSDDDISAMFWALGAHFGRGVSQSARGDLLGLVRDETPPGEPESARGYTSRRELSLHVDLAQIVGLMCVRQAQSGGASQYASGLAVYDEIRAKRPELLPILERGFPYHRRGEEAPGQPQITPHNIPVFSECEGRVSIFLVREIVNAAYRELKRTFTPEEIDAIDAFRATARDLQFETRLEPGEATFLNNYTIMHARSEFEDWSDPQKNRLMLRLWLDVERNARPVVPNIHIYENEGGRSGIDPQPGRFPAVAAYRTPDELVRQARGGQITRGRPALRKRPAELPEAATTESEECFMAGQQSYVYLGLAGETGPGRPAHSGLFRMADGDNEWEALRNGLPERPAVRALAVHPTKPAIIYAGTQSGPYRSADRGEHWEQVELPDHGLPVWSILFHPHNPDVILVGCENCEIYRSDDAGEHWTRLPVSMRFPEITTAPGANPAKRVLMLDASASEPDCLYGAIEVGGTIRSTDGGEHWENLSHGQYINDDMVDMHGVLASRWRPGTVFAIARAGMFRSGDGGDHWSHVPLQPLNIKGQIYCRDIREVPGNPRHLWLAAGSGFISDLGILLRSRDGGDSWTQVDVGAPVPHTMFKVAFDEHRPNRMSCATNGGEVWSSQDGGETWVTQPPPPGGTQIYALARG